jgi:hypothetical protein
MWGQLPAVEGAGSADELVRQLAEAMLEEHITPDEILLAMNRRFGPGAGTAPS